jgi:hypothetical protein
MARLLTGVPRARTVSHRPVDTSDSVVAPPRPGTADRAAADGIAAPAAPTESAPPGAAGAAGAVDADAGSGGGRFGRLLPGRGGGDRAGFDVRNSWQVVAGSFLVPAGVVIILVSWYGAAHTRFVQQQIPYLVSGSFIGLGCMILGGLLYWAHWLYRLYDQADLNHEEMLKAFEQTLRVVADRLTAPEAPLTPAAPVASLATPTPAAAPGRTGTDGFVATAAGSVYHVPSCPVVAHHGDGLRVVGSGDVAGMEPCRICLARRRPILER